MPDQWIPLIETDETDESLADINESVAAFNQRLDAARLLNEWQRFTEPAPVARGEAPGWLARDGWLVRSPDIPIMSPEEAARFLAQPVSPVEVEATGPVPWVPREYDLAEAVTGDARLRAGEIVMIDSIPYRRRGCRDLACSECSHLTVVGLRPNRFTEPQALDSSYFPTFSHALRPLIPTELGEAVRCFTHHSPVGASHPYTAECISPVRVCDGRDLREVAADRAREIFATELAAIEAEQEATRARIAALQPGQRYVVGPGVSWSGYAAEIRPRPWRDRYGEARHPHQVLCNMLELPSLRHVRSEEWVDVEWLGLPIRPWSLNNLPPRFIRMSDRPVYSGNQVTVSDATVGGMEIPETTDHECNNACFDYGCTERSGDYDDDPDEIVAGVPIHNYSYTPNNLIFSGDGPVYLGTELELTAGWGDEGVRGQRAGARIAMESSIGHLIYLKTDGSISGSGFEMVMHPMSYTWMVENWPENLLRDMRRAGMSRHESCGMHVHVSRSGFSSPVHAYKWIKFMYRNERSMSRMARRDPSNWGAFGRPTERAAAKWHAKGGYGAESRYTAINAIPEHTFEVRIFDSTLNRTRFLGSVGLVDASVEYTRQLSTETILKGNGWDFTPFRDYVTSFDKYLPLRREMDRILTN